MAEQVEQDDPVSGTGQRPGDRPVEVGVEQEAVEVHEDVVSRTVDLVGEPITPVVEEAGGWIGGVGTHRGSHEASALVTRAPSASSARSKPSVKVAASGQLVGSAVTLTVSVPS